jgi:hypothetical protein
MQFEQSCVIDCCLIDEINYETLNDAFSCSVLEHLHFLNQDDRLEQEDPLDQWT